MRKEILKKVETLDDINLALNWAKEMLSKAIQGGPAVIRLSRPTRTKDQNALLWPLLKEISDQVMWHEQKLTPEEWKDVFTAALKGQRVVNGIGGGLVFIGAHTSSMTVSELSDLIEFIYSFGAERGVKFKC